MFLGSYLIPSLKNLILSNFSPKEFSDKSKIRLYKLQGSYFIPIFKFFEFFILYPI